MHKRTIFWIYKKCFSDVKFVTLLFPKMMGVKINSMCIFLIRDNISKFMQECAVPISSIWTSRQSNFLTLYILYARKLKTET